MLIDKQLDYIDRIRFALTCSDYWQYFNQCYLRELAYMAKLYSAQPFDNQLHHLNELHRYSSVGELIIHTNDITLLIRYAISLGGAIIIMDNINWSYIYNVMAKYFPGYTEYSIDYIASNLTIGRIYFCEGYLYNNTLPIIYYEYYKMRQHKLNKTSPKIIYATSGEVINRNCVIISKWPYIPRLIYHVIDEPNVFAKKIDLDKENTYHDIHDLIGERDILVRNIWCALNSASPIHARTILCKLINLNSGRHIINTYLLANSDTISRCLSLAKTFTVLDKLSICTYGLYWDNPAAILTDSLMVSGAYNDVEWAVLCYPNLFRCANINELVNMWKESPGALSEDQFMLQLGSLVGRA